MDVLIFMGQSNMQGSTGEYCEFLPKENLLEYKFLTGEAVPLISPVGEDIFASDVLANAPCEKACKPVEKNANNASEKPTLALAAAALGNGSLVPFFCEAYEKKRKCKIFAIHAAKGNTNIDEWQSGSERFNVAVAKIKAGLKKANSIEKVQKVAIVWLQGESDALRFLPKNDYKLKLIGLKNALKAEFNFDKFGIIKTGYFAAYASWISGSFGQKKAADEQIMLAQDEACLEDGDFAVLTGVTKALSQDERYLNPKEFGPHYNNAGMTIIGKEAGVALAEII